jgi:hypothetical protein
LAPCVEGRTVRKFPSWYMANGGKWLQLAGGFLRFECDGFRRFHPELKLSRTWNCTKNRVTFEESLAGRGKAHVRSRLFLGDGEWHPLQWDALERIATMRCSYSDSSSARITSRLPVGLTASMDSASYSPEYGVENPAQVMTLEGTVDLPLQWSLSCEMHL